MIKALLITSTSAAFEWQSGSPYYKGETYTVYLDGKEVLSADTNVFSLFDLTPAKSYKMTVSGCEGEILFSTESETFAVSVRDFGAVGDGITDDTTALRTAIACLPKGARLYVPDGVYLSAPIALKSHMTLDISEGATILGSPDRSKYPVIPGTVSNLNGGELHVGTWEGNSIPMHQALIFGEFLEDVTIVGRGCIDGNGEAGGWWREEIRRAAIKRPKLLFLARCKGVRMHGITVKNSPSWNIHPYFSSDVDIIDVVVSAPKTSPNTDAIDPEACDRVNIIGCRLSVGDDCIAIKSGRMELAKRFKTPASRHTVRNCLMQYGHGALTLGSEIGGGVTDLTVTGCFFDRTDRGLRIKTRRGRGELSVIDGVCFENICMRGVLTPIVINSFYHCDADGHDEYVQTRNALPCDERTPYLGSFVFKDMECRDCEVAACYCEGLPERPIKSITLSNVSFSFKDEATCSLPAMCDGIEPTSRAGMIFKGVESLTVKGVSITGVIGEELITENIGKIEKI